MEVNAISTPAEMLFADARENAAADEVPSYDPASTTPQSLMSELPPRPPSPYRTMQHSTHRSGPGKASVASSFLRGRRVAHGMSAAPTQTSTVPRDGEVGSGKTQRGLSPTHPLLARHTEKGDSAVVYADAETHDSAMEHYLVYGAPRQRLCEYEESDRNALLATEEVVFTGLVIQALQARAELLAGDEAAELVVAAALERAEARREMLQVIEVGVAARLREERLRALLEVQSRALLPAHAAGYHRIEAEEREGLKEVFQWHKEHRPLGPGCFIRGPEEDYRLRNVSRGTSAATTSPGSCSLVNQGGQRSALTSARSSREYAEELRRQNSASSSPHAALGELALLSSAGPTSRTASTQDGTFGPGEEAVFVEEGRLQQQLQKSRRHEELREKRRFTDLAEAQAEARQYVLAEEALCYMHLIRGAVDGLYEAAEATRGRQGREKAEAEARAVRDAERLALKEQMLRERGLPEAPAESPGDKTDEGGAPPTATAAPRPASKTSIVGALAVRGVHGETSPLRRESTSTVAESTAATDASLDQLPEMDERSPATSEDKSAQLAHLRLIAEETESSTMCRQLTNLTTSQTTIDVQDEL